MLETKAVFSRKEPEIGATDCVVDKVIRLSGAEFDRFSKNLLHDWDFIRDNAPDRVVDKEGRHHCLLVVGEERHDGIMVNPEGGSYARYSALIPNAAAWLAAEQYPSLAKLNKKLADIVDFIAEPTGQKQTVDLYEIENQFGVDFMTNSVLRDTVLEMLGEKPEIKDFELDKNELIIYYDKESPEKAAENISDPTVSLTDMYAYGYSYIGMNPLGKEKALELFDKGYEIFRLYENDSEGVADDRAEIESFDGLFGISNPEWDTPDRLELPFQIFILNREKNANGELSGNWLTLPADPVTLREHLERIGVERPSEGAFTITAVRMPLEEYIRDYVSKYDGVDELNMLASHINDMQDYEIDKFKAILRSGTYIGRDTAALINLLDADNFDAFNLIKVKNAEELGRYYANENDEVSDGVSYEDYGKQCIFKEGGSFTEQGYIYFRSKEISKEYDGVVPNEYKIVENALRGLREKTQGRGSNDKPSVMAQIKASRQSSGEPQERDSQKNKKIKKEPDL